MHGEDFIKSVFREYANESDCLIHEHGFDHLLHDLAVAEHANHDHDDHGHAHSINTYGLVFDFWGGGLAQTEEDKHNHEHEHEHGGGNAPTNASYNVTIIINY